MNCKLTNLKDSCAFMKFTLVEAGDLGAYIDNEQYVGGKTLDYAGFYRDTLIERITDGYKEYLECMGTELAEVLGVTNLESYVAETAFLNCNADAMIIPADMKGCITPNISFKMFRHCLLNTMTVCRIARDINFDTSFITAEKLEKLFSKYSFKNDLHRSYFKHMAVAKNIAGKLDFTMKIDE